MKRPRLIWSNFELFDNGDRKVRERKVMESIGMIATSATTLTGWWFGRQITAVPKARFFARGTRPAMNISGEGIGSVVAEKCSPSHSSSKPSRSA
jgi:hypothetical protein